MNNADKTRAFWHRESFDGFIDDTLPQLLARRLPLTGYAVSPQDTYSCRITVAVEGVEADYTILRPDDDGRFLVDGNLFVVVPLASTEHLDKAEIKCVGEQLYDYADSHLGEASGELPWDEQLLRAWLPLDAWVLNVVTSAPRESWLLPASGQRLDTTNGIAAQAHLRRIVIPEIENVIAAGQFGRVCPFETPESPNIGHIFSVALGAAIRNGRFEIVDATPEAALGLTASMVPFLEHNDPNRQLMGVNMMRQWLVPSDPEPALVQTGNEPDAPNFWCGRNLLTAFVSWGEDTYEDAIVISESCAQKLSYPDTPAEPGDKISNRHGSKGVISRILRDEEMPHLPDGTPVDLVYSFIGLHTRLNFGQVREALMSRIAHAEGEAAIVPPFHAPDESELLDRLKKAGLPEDGMETLLAGRNGKPLERRSMVGWVYWGRTVHLAGQKIHACAGPGRTNRPGEMEYYVLRDAGCLENVAETYNTRSEDREDSAELPAMVESGPIQQAGPPSPKFAELQRRLAAAGIKVELVDDKLTFLFDPPAGQTLNLAHSVPHPWLPDRQLTEIGVIDKPDEYPRLEEANTNMGRAIESDAPESLRKRALADLEHTVNDYIRELLTPENLRFRNRVMFAGRTVLAPALGLGTDQVGLADEIAWTIFGPLVTREIGDRNEVEHRTGSAAKALDDVMARSWIILSRAPALMPTSTIAFRPVRIPDKVIRLHPLACLPMNADFDGDQAAVFLPLTEGAQHEAAERLSLAAHLARDPDLRGMRVLTGGAPVGGLLTNEALWGIAKLSVTDDGLREIEELAGTRVSAPDGFVTRESAAAAFQERLERDGIDEALAALERLYRRGLAVTKDSGASISPFIGSDIQRPCEPEGDDPERWSAYSEQITEQIVGSSDFASNQLGPQLLAVKSGARGNLAQLLRLAGIGVVVMDVSGKLVPIKHSYCEGLTPEEMFSCVRGARQGLADVSLKCADRAYGIRSDRQTKRFTVLARAMRAEHPGIVFARAAAIGEVDPLTDLDSRLFVGLPPEP